MDKDKSRIRFEKLLRDTGRENIDYVLEDLDNWGFFEAPASSQGHGAFAGGLLEHSLNVYDAAMDARKSMIELRPDLEPDLDVDSIAIAALLHDVCKADFYRLVKKKRRNEVGQYEEFEQYEIHDENFPVGHGEKSVILLLQSGLDLKDDEIYAIRWHMGPWNLSRDDEKFYRQAGRATPLQPLIHAADTLASAIIERPGKKM
ncbi:HD domain-containing protein [uncultured Muribaculum sp.]|uniref:HD domain-containing protein n=1 Tax=uncultured Muribaculum sp. TaxID=1918613 RepID=UPI0026F30887|nr:HD domain-containing protein [uncultured Muribaculum sp.]